MLNSTLNSNSLTWNLSKLQESLLKEQKRLRFSEQTVQYSINSLQLDDLPQGLPQQLILSSSKCLRLSGCGFFQMLTYAIWQFLLSCRNVSKNDVIKKIRKQIVEKQFMEECPSTKGLLVKGIKQMHDYIQLSNQNKLIAHCLWKTDSMLAFSEFWKALLAKLSMRNIIGSDETPNLDSGVFQLLADFLEINFVVFYQNGNNYEKQLYTSKKKESQLKLSLLISSSSKNKPKQSSQLLESSSMFLQSSLFLQINQWHYTIFEDKQQSFSSQLSREDISMIRPMDQSVQEEKEEFIKLFKLKTKSQLNLQRLGNDLNHSPREILSPYSSRINDKKHLQTARTRKSRITATHDGGKTQFKNSSLAQDKIDYEQTLLHLNNIKNNMQLTDQLIHQMKVFCENIKV